MIDVNELWNEKSKYQYLKDDINKIIKSLNNAIENLEVPSNRIKDLYTIDSISIDEKSLSSVRENLINKKNYLYDTILYEINNKIYEIEKNIESVG